MTNLVEINDSNTSADTSHILVFVNKSSLAGAFRKELCEKDKAMYESIC